MSPEDYEKGRAILKEMLGEKADAAAESMREMDPDFEEMVMSFVMSDLYGREGLDLKTRLLCTIAALTVMGRQAQLAVHVDRAIGAGASAEEIREVILQMAGFGGFPATWDALLTLKERLAK
ncbi:MAG: carboxymuconolactone decarboxylase family protein [Candidatus Latescibacterota bacterium]|nr:carboxymuconolactone decarboxylase family protein [Candidatus Latescibacterota bacterium]